MQTNLDQELDTIQRNSKGWSSLLYYDRTLLQKLGTCLQSCLELTSDDVFLNLVINRRPQAFDMFEYVAVHLLKQWYSQNRALSVEQLNYLAIVGLFNRRLALTLQNDNDDADGSSEENVLAKNNLDHHRRVRELLIDNNSEIFDLLIKFLPRMNTSESDFIEMILPWYESYTFFEHSYIDSRLDEKFAYFNQEIVLCLKSDEYKQNLLLANTDQPIIITPQHRFYLGMCTMAMGIHVNCDDNESDDAKILLELYLSHYLTLISYFSNQNQQNQLNNFACLTGIVTYLVNYTLIIDTDNNRQLLVDLFSIILNVNIYMKVAINWSNYETILIDSIICYLIIYCFDNILLVQNLLQTENDAIRKLETLIEQAQACGNRRIGIMGQLFLLILTSSSKYEDLAEKLFLSCLNYIQMSLENTHTYHYNRIPMGMFFKSLINIVKYDYIQDIIQAQYLNLFINIIMNYERKKLYNTMTYHECALITVNILWSLSFNENIKNILKQNTQEFFDIIEKLNVNTNESFVKQATCGLLYNLDQLDLSQCLSKNEQTYGKTIGISYDPSDLKLVELIEQELNKKGLRVWTAYDYMNENFVPTFISLMNSTNCLIVCLSDMYRLNNRCRTELFYATTSGHRVLSWKVEMPTNNHDEDERIRKQAIETLIKRIIPNENKQVKVLQPTIDTTNITVDINDRHMSEDFPSRQRTQDLMNFEHWTNREVLAWCESLNLPGFLKLFKTFNGQSVIKLYEFCKQNSTETIALLNSDLHHICEQEHVPDIQISVYEFIQFQIEVEKMLPKTKFENSTLSLSLSKHRRYKGIKIKTCSIL